MPHGPASSSHDECNRVDALARVPGGGLHRRRAEDEAREGWRP